jgi:hypothetical protein
MDLSDASEKIPSDTTGDRSGDLPTSSAADVHGRIILKYILQKQEAKCDCADLVQYSDISGNVLNHINLFQLD